MSYAALMGEMVGAQRGLKGTWRLFNIEVKALDDPGKDSAAVSPALLKVHPQHRSSEQITTRTISIRWPSCERTRMLG